MEEIEQKDKGDSKKKVGHLMAIIALRRVMDLDGHGRHRPQKDKQKNNSADNLRSDKMPEGCRQQISELTALHFRPKFSSIVSKHTFMLPLQYFEFKPHIYYP